MQCDHRQVTYPLFLKQNFTNYVTSKIYRFLKIKRSKYGGYLYFVVIGLARYLFCRTIGVPQSKYAIC